MHPSTRLYIPQPCTCLLLLQFFLSDIFPELINHKIVKPVFAVVVALLFVCPQVTWALKLQECRLSCLA